MVIDTASVVTILLIIPVLTVLLGVFLTRRAKEEANLQKGINTGINNAVVDLYEKGYIVSEGDKGDRMVRLGKSEETLTDFQQTVLDLTLAGENQAITTKDFHTRVYTARRTLANKMELPSITETVDFRTKPSDRIYSDKADENSIVVLPLLLLGTAEGSHFAGNPAYAGDIGYVGGGDFGGDSGGDGGDGGGDGGGGGD